MLDKNYGFCRAVNIGIKEADTPFVFLLNNDTLVCKGAVDALLAAIRQDDRIFSVESKVIQYQDHGRLDSAGTYYNALGWAFGPWQGQARPFAIRRKQIVLRPAEALLSTGKRHLMILDTLMRSILHIWKM